VKATSPERYNDTNVLPTYVETKNITIYGHGPIGVRPFEAFFKHLGTRTMIAYVKPAHWHKITHDYTNHHHILVLRNPIEQHKHATFLHAMSMRDIKRKRDNMFYHTHLAPYLQTVQSAQFDFYIDFDDLHKYLFEYEQPSPPVADTELFFDISEDMDAYLSIKENKMKLEVAQWRELLMRGQIEEI